MRFYRALLRLYPASFRREFEAEMLAVVAARRGEVRGPLAVVLFWLGTVAEVLGNAAAAHWDILRQDLRYVGRSLARAPGFTLTAVLVTALGVGANTAAFSVTDFVLIRPLPFPDPDRIIRLWQAPPGFRVEFSPANYRDVRAMSRSFESLGAYTSFAANVTGLADPLRVEGFRMTPDVFSSLRIAPVLGRVFTEADVRPDAPASLVVSHGFWQSELGGAPDVVGRQVTLDGRPHEIIGVMPRGFQFPSATSRIWQPLRFTEQDFEDRGDNYLDLVGRLKPGVSLEAARADLRVVAGRIASDYPATNRDVGAMLLPIGRDLSGKSRLLLLALAGASFCILLVACANLGNLLLARGAVRRRELAVRAALGAGRDRLVRQVITETLVVAALGGALGVMLAVLGVPLLRSLVPDTRPMAGEPSVNFRVLVVSAVLALLTSILFAVLPARQLGPRAGFGALQESGRAGGGRRQRMRAVLVTIEVAASVVLLVSAGLLMRAIARVNDVEPGFRVENVLTLRTALPSPKYDSGASRHRFYTAVLAEVKALPGVTDAGYVSFLPMVMGGGIRPVSFPGRPEAQDGSEAASLRFVTPGYFGAMRIPVRKGRDASDADNAKSPFVALVSESFVERFWPGQEPLGKRFRIGNYEREVVGVVGEVKVRGLERENEPQVYLPEQQQPEGLGNYWPKDLAVRSGADPATLVPAIRRIVSQVDPEQPIAGVRTMADILAEQTASRAVQLRVLGAFAAIAILLAAVGIHGLLSFMVSQRAQEFGVRMALGASGANLVGMVLGHGVTLALAGIVPGIITAYLAARAMRAVLFGVPPADTVTFGTVVAVCITMTVAGCLAPALRAVRVDPVRAMRSE